MVTSMTADAITPPTKTKPKFRGVSHELTFYVALVVMGGLAYAAAPGLPRISGLIYGASLVILFGTSALYHRPMWSPLARARMRRADHAAIFVLIAGSYVPMGLLALPPEVGRRLLQLVVGGCALGIVKSMFWAHSPRWITVAIYVTVSWAAALELPAIARALGPTRTTLLLAGGICYSLGALVYARRKPDPVPAVFGYHEVFHVFVIVAAALQFAAIGSVVLNA